jgi:hypothetical protein
MKKKMMFGAALVVSAMMASCSQNTDFVGQTEDGEGLLTLSLSSDANFKGSTRAVSESSYKVVDNYTVVVTDKDGVERLRCYGSEVSSRLPITLPLGSCLVEAFYGTEKAYSRDAFYVYGRTYRTITDGETASAEVVCTPTCGRIAVNFGSEMSKYYNDYNVTFSGTEAMGEDVITWTKNDTEPWYVKLNEGGETISFTITTTPKDEYVNNEQQGNVKTGTFTLNRNKAYKMNIAPNYTSTDFANIKISITIDESTNDKPVDIEVPIEWAN